MIDIRKLFLGAYPNLNEINPFGNIKFFIMGDDEDSLLSFFALKTFNKNIKLVGIYKSFDELYLDKTYYKNIEENLKYTAFIDLDINNKHCFSIGHHILIDDKNDIDHYKDLVNSCNPNTLFKIDHKNDFTKKFPFSTAHFLVWYFKLFDLMKLDKFRLLLSLSDSFYINVQKYSDNCFEWVKRMDFGIYERDMQRMIHDETFEYEMRNLMNEMEKWGFERGYGQSTSKYLNLSGFQCQAKRIPEDIIKGIRFLNYLFPGLEINENDILLDDLILIKGVRRIINDLNELTKINKLYHYVKNNEAFSYAITNKNKINITALDLFINLMVFI